MCIWEEPTIRFWRKVDKRGPIPAHWPELGPCWEWRAHLDHDGYGLFWSGKRKMKAHRFLWELVNGPIPKGLEQDHLCRNRGCVRDTHIDLVTHDENLRRSPLTLASTNRRKTHCVRGHELAGANLLDWSTAKGYRGCKACNILYQAKYKAKKEGGQLRY